MKPDSIYMVPLGGCGFFGANMTLYGYNGQWIMVDCGMGFADDTMPGVDVLLPDPSFAAELGDGLLAIVLTHGHEDHIGAIPYLWPRLRKPLYATKFTAGRIRNAIDDQQWGPEARIHEVPPRGRLEFGPFNIQYIPMAHSIPEANALAITVKSVGTILHTGDWKIDPDPVEGELTDEKALQKLGQSGVLALVGDSTNAMVPGHSGSERTVRENLIDLFGEFKDKIAVTCFATNVARLAGIDAAAKANGRKTCLVGRSLWKTEDVARQSGYLKDTRPFIDEDEAGLLKDDKIVYVCTGSQGEPRSALAKISGEEHPRVRLRPNDVVIFSSRAIPGNQRAIDRMKNRFYAAGVNVVTDREAPVHVSGHPYREELKQLYAWTKPKIAIPVHGEQMQLEKHAALARESGVEQTVMPANGQVLEIASEGIASYVGEVKSGILAVEGGRVVAIDHEAILTRKRMMFNGSAVVTVVVDAHGKLAAPPKVTALGLLDENSELDAQYIADAVKEIKNAVQNAPKELRGDDDALSEMIRVTARRFFNARFDRKPQTRVHLVRI
ncbi:MAG: ribonuclease J [Alphaproteobacteria bacterium]|nr:ribonuclease J [Alphaproteobacteria bacterium]